VKGASCARPACPGQPVAWLAYDYDARCAWLDDDPVATNELSHRWPLCERHADNLRVPRGWFCVDRRARGGGDVDDVAPLVPPGDADGIGDGAPEADGPSGDGGKPGAARRAPREPEVQRAGGPTGADRAGPVAKPPGDGGPAPSGGRLSAIL
jgi:hypothetical protein